MRSFGELDALTHRERGRTPLYAKAIDEAREWASSHTSASTSEDDLREVFSGIGIISRVKQRTGFPDQWPYAVKIYRDERGEKKDEAVITYDDPHAAQSAPSFYDGYEFNGKKLHVSIAQSRPRPEGGAPPPPPGGGGDRGGYDRGGGRDYGRHRPY